MAIFVPSASFFNKASEMKPVDLDDKLKGANSEKLVNQDWFKLVVYLKVA